MCFDVKLLRVDPSAVRPLSKKAQQIPANRRPCAREAAVPAKVAKCCKQSVTAHHYFPHQVEKAPPSPQTPELKWEMALAESNIVRCLVHVRKCWMSLNQLSEFDARG